MQKIIAKIALAALLVLPFGAALPVGATTIPYWNTAGTYGVTFDYLGTDYAHDMTLTQDNLGNLTGNGGYPTGGPFTYAWSIDSGSVITNAIHLNIHYTAGASCSMVMDGTIATDGTMNGNWTDDCGGPRAGTWHTTTGSAILLGALSAEDFGVVNYDTGLGMLKGYSAGFGLTDATFAGVQSVVEKLYAGTTLLQTNTATAKVGIDITGAQISSPFDVSGTFNYSTDGYWINTKEAEYGQNIAATKVVATVTLANGKIVTAENTNLSGDPATIFPSSTPANVQVHIFKYLDGAQATAANANSVSFPMITTFNDAVVGSGTNVPFTLNPSGWTTGDIAYEASTGPRTPGSSATFSEDTSTALVGTSCDSDTPYALTGYSVGSTLAETIAAASTSTIPSFANLNSDEYVIVRNITCETAEPTTLKVHIQKYLDGVLATAATANNYQFPMAATWMTANLNGGASTSGNYVLGNNHGGAADLYGADTSAMQVPAAYMTKEITNDIDNTSKVSPINGTCVAGNYQLVGYQASMVSFADAAVQTISATAPDFAALPSDEYIIVRNITCPVTGTLTVEKDVIGPNATSTFNFISDIPGNASFSITTANGVGYSQTFTNLVPGVYHVTETNIPKGWTQTDSDCSAITIAAGATSTCVVTNTSNKLLGQIRGTKFEDRDGDGSLMDRDNRGLAGWTMYLDKNNNGTLDNGEPSTVTDRRGNYRFSNLPAGTYYVREVSQPGWIQTYPASGSFTVVLAAGKISKKDNFGNFKLGSISGMKFNDINGNRRKDNGEMGLQGWTINLTKVGSPAVATSTVTDANGNYSFANLDAGTYQIREVSQTGWVQTTNNPVNVKVNSGTISKNNNFGNHLGPVVGNNHFGRYYYNNGHFNWRPSKF